KIFKTYNNVFGNLKIDTNMFQQLIDMHNPAIFTSNNESIQKHAMLYPKLHNPESIGIKNDALNSQESQLAHKNNAKLQRFLTNWHTSFFGEDMTLSIHISSFPLVVFTQRPDGGRETIESTVPKYPSPNEAILMIFEDCGGHIEHLTRETITSLGYFDMRSLRNNVLYSTDYVRRFLLAALLNHAKREKQNTTPVSTTPPTQPAA
ncbi:MAG: hypothetical protein Q8K36_00090, partial [Alphaproteobacteria bacterium]|nr:hypothetical protein [Alphaproteobacteria bacterium]